MSITDIVRECAADVEELQSTSSGTGSIVDQLERACKLTLKVDDHEWQDLSKMFIYMDNFQKVGTPPIILFWMCIHFGWKLRGQKDRENA